MKQIFILLCICGLSVFGQTNPEPVKINCGTQSNPYAALDLSLSAAKGQFLTSLGIAKMFSMKRYDDSRFKLGIGIRYSGYIGANQLYTTAPSKYTSPIQNLGTIFSETIAENIDTIAIAKTSQTNSINLSIHLQYSIGKSRKTDLGFNIDAVGFSFGRSKVATVISSDLDANSAPVQSATPTKWNVLLTSDNDIGSLNSEFYVRRWVSERWAIKTGFTFYFSEYTTKEKVSFDSGRIVNDRYRRKASLFMVGISYKM